MVTEKTPGLDSGIDGKVLNDLEILVLTIKIVPEVEIRICYYICDSME